MLFSSHSAGSHCSCLSFLAPSSIQLFRKASLQLASAGTVVYHWAACCASNSITRARSFSTSTANPAYQVRIRCCQVHQTGSSVSWHHRTATRGIQGCRAHLQLACWLALVGKAAAGTLKRHVGRPHRAPLPPAAAAGPEHHMRLCSGLQ